MSSIMPNDRRNDELARRSLLNLSERSARDVVNSLEDLRQRLMTSSMGSPQSGLLPRDRESISRRHSGAAKKEAPLRQQQRRRQQQQVPRKRDKDKDKGQPKGSHKDAIAAGRSKPSLSSVAGSDSHPCQDVVRGAWVRTRNGSSSPVTVITSHALKIQPKTAGTTIT